jgi:hypothetical protein
VRAIAVGRVPDPSAAKFPLLSRLFLICHDLPKLVQVTVAAVASDVFQSMSLAVYKTRGLIGSITKGLIKDPLPYFLNFHRNFTYLLQVDHC